MPKSKSPNTTSATLADPVEPSETRPLIDWREIITLVPPHQRLPALIFPLLEVVLLRALWSSYVSVQAIGISGMIVIALVFLWLVLRPERPTRVLEVDPKTTNPIDPEAVKLYRSGLDQKDVGNFTAAYRLFERSVELSPGFLEARYAMAICLQRQKKFRLAEQAYNSLIGHIEAMDLPETAPEQTIRSWAFNQIGHIGMKQRHYSESYQNFLKAHQGRPEEGVFPTNMMVAAAAAGMELEARQLYSYLDSDPVLRSNFDLLDGYDLDIMRRYTWWQYSPPAQDLLPGRKAEKENDDATN